MTDDSQKPNGTLKAKPGYEVGYARPPETTRFQKGTSGNPRGRPKGAKNKQSMPGLERMKEILLEEAYREITVRDGDRNVSVPMARAVVRAIAVNAAKGQHRSQRLFAEMLGETERQDKARNDAWLETAINYKVDWERELERRQRLNVTDLPPPLPHPDDIVLDLRGNTARVVGPLTKEEKAEHDEWLARLADYEEEREYLKMELDGETDPGMLEYLKEDMQKTEELIMAIKGMLGEWNCQREF